MEEIDAGMGGTMLASALADSRSVQLIRHAPRFPIAFSDRKNFLIRRRGDLKIAPSECAFRHRLFSSTQRKL